MIQKRKQKVSINMGPDKKKKKFLDELNIPYYILDPEDIVIPKKGELLENIDNSQYPYGLGKEWEK